MKIYVLIVVCFYIIALGNLIKSINDENDNDFIASLIAVAICIIAICIIAIVFQSINL
jgi:hypothetical protein